MVTPQFYKNILNIILNILFLPQYSCSFFSDLSLKYSNFSRSVLHQKISHQKKLNFKQNKTYIKQSKDRSSRPEVFCKKGVFRNFAKFIGKHLCQSLFFNKKRPEACNVIKKGTLAQVFSC